MACLVFRNVIGEALIVEVTKDGELSNTNEKDKQANAQGQVSMFFGARSIGSLIFSYIGGAILEIISYRSVFLLCAILPTIVIIKTLGFHEN